MQLIRSVTAEAYIDLCYGYLDRAELEKARFYGETGLELASEPARFAMPTTSSARSPTRSATPTRPSFTSKNWRIYPQFRHLKSLLFAIDLRSMMNLKL